MKYRIKEISVKKADGTTWVTFIPQFKFIFWFCFKYVEQCGIELYTYGEEFDTFQEAWDFIKKRNYKNKKQITYHPYTGSSNK